MNPPVTTWEYQLLAAAVALLSGTSLAMLVYALFGQRGQAEITPERQVAVAAGHVDRQTVFESAILAPIMWLLLQTALRLPIPVWRRRLRETLVAAGSPNFYTPDEYLALAGLYAIVSALLMQGLNLVMLHAVASVVMAVGCVLGFAGCLLHLRSQAAKRIKDIGRRVPYTLDLIALAMGAGATFTEAVRTVIREDPTHPFNVELNTVLAEVELGTTRQQALRNMADRIPLEGLRSIIAAIIQAEGLGTPLSDVLKQQASLLRLQRSVRAEKMAAQASVRILVPSMLILAAVVLTVFGPIIIRFLRGELF